MVWIPSSTLFLHITVSATALDGHAYKYGGSSEEGCATLGLLTQYYGYPQEGIWVQDHFLSVRFYSS